MRTLSVTISSPCHPAMAEMVSALERDVKYQFVGPRVRDGYGTSAAIGSIARFAYDEAVRLRKNAWGAVAYHRTRSFVLLRSVPKGALVHCCSHLSYRGGPWIGDYENVNVLAFYSPGLLRDQHFLSHLLKMFRHRSCRAIRVWSASAERPFQALFEDEDIRRKIRVVHPTITLPPEALMALRRGGLTRILFVARGFWIKGGALFLEAVSQLRRELEFCVDFVCDLPVECEHYRTALSGVVNFYEPVFTRPELYARFYNIADVFVMLGMADSYGLTLLEASAFGLPILAMQLNSGLSDFLRLAGNAIQVEPPHQIFDSDGLHCLEPDELVQRIQSDTQPLAVERVAEALRLLISDRDKREQLGERGRVALLNGPFSVATMRGAMLDLYQGAMD